MDEWSSDQNPCHGHRSVFLVEHRQNFGPLTDAAGKTVSVWDTTVVFTASTLERAEQFCRQNAAYDDHDPARPWAFAVTEEKVDCDLVAWSTRVVCFYDWDGVRHDDCPDYFLAPQTVGA